MGHHFQTVSIYEASHRTGGTSWTVRWIDPAKGERINRSCGPGDAGKHNAEDLKQKIEAELIRHYKAIPVSESKGMTFEEAWGKHRFGKYRLRQLSREGKLAWWDEWRIVEDETGTRILQPCRVFDSEQLAAKAQNQKPWPTDKNLEARNQAAREFIKNFLADGPRRAPDVRKAAKEAGIEEMRLSAMAKALGVKFDCPGGSLNKEWWWALPNGQKDSPLDKAVAVVEGLLRNGPVESSMFARKAREAGLTQHFVRQACAQLADVHRTRPGTHGPWYVWRDGQEIPAPALQPRWDSAQGELWLGNKLLKRLDGRAKLQIVLLEAFEAEHWKKTIENPFKEMMDGNDVLYQTCKKLNRTNSVISFRRDGRGKGACWDAVSP